jgi:hypothetical protein
LNLLPVGILLGFGKEVRQILYFLEKRMTVAEICYNMHASSFHIYAQLYDLVSKGVARVAGEMPDVVDPEGTGRTCEEDFPIRWIRRVRF